MGRILSELAPKPVYDIRRLTDGVDYPCINMAKTAKRCAASILMDEGRNVEAATRVNGSPQAFRDFASVYVIGLEGEPRCKIGYSNNPQRRMASLQTALWAEVKCFALFWAPQFVASQIELCALRLAKRHNLRLRGEWVNLPPDEAVGLVLTAMDQTSAFCDSATFLEHWAPHKERLFEPGGDFALALRRQASEDMTFRGIAMPEPKGWIYEAR